MCDTPLCPEQPRSRALPLNPARRTLLKFGLGAGVGLLFVSCGLTPTPQGGTPPNDAASFGPLAVPAMASCATWGAAAARGTITLLDQRPVRILVHHTATPNTSDLSQTQAYRLARSIQQAHFSNGWIDSGQHFTISRGGYVMEGRHGSLDALQGGRQQVQGAHCPGQNDVAIGIENEGTYSSVQPPAALYSRLVELCTSVCQQYGIAATEIYGHRDFYATACPGDVLYSMLPQLRQDVASRLGQPAPAPTWPVLRRGSQGQAVRTAQYLLRDQGQGVTVDGQFGSGTETAVRAVQQARGLQSDGVVGADTWAVLIRTLRQGDQGEAVRGLQDALSGRGQATAVDGAFGAGTDQALRRYQTSRGLTSDGVAGPKSWQALVNG